jgi:hypothetical protein
MRQAQATMNQVNATSIQPIATRQRPR